MGRLKCIRCTAAVFFAIGVTGWAGADAMASGATFDIAAGSATTTLKKFASQAHVQLLFDYKAVEKLKTPRVKGQLEPRDALKALLRGSGFTFREVNDHTIAVIAPGAPAAASQEAQSSSMASGSREKEGKTQSSGTFRLAQVDQGTVRSGSAVAEPNVSEVVVTARKVTESVVNVPESITSFSQQTLQAFNIQTFDDYATKVPNLGFSYGTGGLGFSTSRTISIRGISGSGTTAMYIDDTPVFDDMDPRVVDIERIEVLEGPQGTLFGEGSLGGAVRLITRQPQMNTYSVDYSGEAGYTTDGGSPDGGVNAVINAGLVPDLIAVRAVTFYDHTPGFITRSFPDSTSPTGMASIGDQGARTDYGGSLSVLFKLTDQLHVTARMLVQHTEFMGLPVAYAPLPAFQVVSLIQDRTANIQEGADDEWYLPSIQLNFDGRGFDIVSSTTYFSRRTDDTENGTEGTYQALYDFYGTTLAPQPDPWFENTTFNRLTHETRVSFDRTHRVSGIFGVWYSRTDTVGIIEPNYLPGLAATGIYPTDLDWSNWAGSTTTEKALFGELYVDLPYNFTATLGARQYWLAQETTFYADGIFNGGFSGYDNSNAEHGVSPKYALQYKIQDNSSAYVDAAKGFRAGGAGGGLPSFCDAGLAAIGLTPEEATKFNPDTVWNYEVGAKSELLDQRFLVTGALFQQEWQHIQQTLFIPSCGFTFEGNAGAARARGAELQATGRLLPSLEIRAGFGYDDARITSSGASGEAVGTRVRETPEITETAGFEYTRALTSNYEGFISSDYSHVGDSLSSVSSASSILVRPAYNLVNARLGVRWGVYELALFAKNLTNAKPNLGDLNPISYSRYVLNAEGMPVILPRVATLEPFTIGLQFRGSF
jgi:iron complex outermembrane recepter protein